MKLIDEWKSAWRMFSMQAMAAAVVLQTVWPEIPAEIKADWPPHAVHWITVVVLVLGGIGRLVKQAPKEPPP
jgi:hypothetical protein